MRKIVLFHHYNSSLGAGMCLLHILQNIDKSKYDVIVYLPAIKGDLGAKINDMGIKAVHNKDASLAYMHFNGAQKMIWNIRSIKNCIDINKSKKEVERILKSENPDIVMVNSMTLFWIGKIAKKINIRTCCFHRETYCHGLFGLRTSYIKRSLKKYFDKVIFISNYDMNL